MTGSLKSLPKLSDRLKYIRITHALSQIELAKIAGTTQQAIQQAEAGKARQPRYLHHIARALNIPFEWLAFNDMPMEKTALKPGLSDREHEVVSNFRALSKKEQKLILDLMKAQRTKS